MVSFAQAKALRAAALESAIALKMTENPNENIDFLWQQWADVQAGSSTGGSGGSTSAADVADGIDTSDDIQTISERLLSLVDGQLAIGDITTAVDGSTQLTATNQALTTQIQPDVSALRIALSYLEIPPQMRPVDFNVPVGSEEVLFSPQAGDALLWGYSLVFSEPAVMRLRDDTNGSLALYDSINAASEHFARPSLLNSKLFVEVVSQVSGLPVRITGFVLIAEGSV